MSFPTFAVPPRGEFLRDALGNPLPDESLLVLKHIDRLERENAALRKDKERLDWLEECHAWPEYIDAEWHVVGEVFSSYRAAIDAARKEGQL